MENNLKKFVKNVIDILSCCESGHPEALEWFIQQDRSEHNVDYIEYQGDAALCAKWYMDHVAYS